MVLFKKIKDDGCGAGVGLQGLECDLRFGEADLDWRGWVQISYFWSVRGNGIQRCVSRACEPASLRL